MKELKNEIYDKDNGFCSFSLVASSRGNPFPR